MQVFGFYKIIRLCDRQGTVVNPLQPVFLLNCALVLKYFQTYRGLVDVQNKCKLGVSTFSDTGASVPNDGPGHKIKVVLHPLNTFERSVVQEKTCPRSGMQCD